MGDEGEYGEMAEIGAHYGGGGRWVGGGGGGGAINSPQHHHLHPNNMQASSPATSRYAQRPTGSYEAEDAMARGGGSSRGRSGLYYSPPGTSYTIVERPTTAPSSQHSLHHPGASKHPRGTYLGSSATFNNVNNRSHPAMSNGKKRPISPEQVLKLMGAGGGAPKMTAGHASGRRSAVSSPASSPASHLHHQNVQEDLLVRTVNMVRPADSPQGFGICVKGGKDSGNSVYISRVEENSVAERVGLRAGDTILEVNGTPFKGISHEEALKMLKSNRILSMTVKSPNLLPYEPPPERPPVGAGVGVGAGSAPWMVRQTYSWMDRQGRPVSPPLEYARAPPPVIVAPPPNMPRYYARPGKDKATRKVDLSIDPGQSLGLMIRGGVEYNLGIFITGVDKDSVADRAGLMIGDQILEVNGQSFLDISHDDAVNQLKFYKRMTLTVRDVGKVPHSCTAYDDLVAWESATAHSPGHMGGMHKMRSPALMMVEEKARILLKKSEFTTLAYYQEEYAARQMTIEAFVAVLLELLNTHEKYTLLTELREVVLPEDRSRFDELVYRREVEGQRCRDFQDMLDQREHEKQGVAPPRQRGGGGAVSEPNHAILMSNLHDLPGPPEYRTSAARPCQFPVVPEGGAGAGAGAGGAGGAGAGYVPYNEPEEFRTPSEDSGVGMSLEIANTRATSNTSRGESYAGGQGWAGSPTSSQRQRTSDLALSSDGDHAQDYGTCEGNGRRNRRHSSPEESRRGSLDEMEHQPSHYGQDANMCGYLEGLRSQLGGWTQKVKSWYWGRPLEIGHKMSRSFDMKENQEMLESDSSAMRRHHSMQRLSRGDLADSAIDEELAALVVPDQEGNLRITVKKTKPILGIAIEGGANTKHPLPRIINIHDNGAAFDAGGLEVGQLILEVDGQKVEGMHHQDVARLIAESFARRDRHDIEFLVIEAKKSNLEPKPTALIFLEA